MTPWVLFRQFARWRWVHLIGGDNMSAIRYYAYLRVSTTKQDVARQYEAINNWKEKNKIHVLNKVKFFKQLL